ncbi:hypothetical protein [Streptomyces sp. NPDC088748]|uniref:hypothetical protein n=1 Tax=Streptomyces sp. NPDC088748 TaxID=3365887 RepID=UPI0038003263
MAEEYPQFQLKLPHGGPTARGRLLSEMGTNGSQKMMVLAGSPARPDVVPSFPLRMPSSHRLREKLIAFLRGDTRDRHLARMVGGGSGR